MTEIEMLKEMLSMQEEYDQMVFKAHGMSGYGDINSTMLYHALLDEVGELNHELKADWVLVEKHAGGTGWRKSS